MQVALRLGERANGGTIDIPAMTERSYAVAALNYRRMPTHPFPAEIVVAKCAIRFPRAQAADYQFKTD